MNRTDWCGSFVNERFHTRFLHRHAHAFIEPLGRWILAPHVERNIVAAIVAREAHDVFVKRPAYTLPAQMLEDTKVVDVERADVGEHIVGLVLLEDAEGVAKGAVAVVDSDKDGSAVIGQNADELAVGVFAADFEQIGPP